MKLNVLILLIFFSFVLNAQTTSVPLKEINADLPDETEETDLLDKGELQVETAFLYNHFSSDASPKIVQSLIRYGLFNYLEARLLIEDGYARDKYLEETVQSTAPLALSTKISLLKDHSILPNITLVGYLKLPFTSRTGEQIPYWAPNVSLAFQHKFGDKWKLEYNVGGQQEVYSTDWVEFSTPPFITKWLIALSFSQSIMDNIRLAKIRSIMLVLVLSTRLIITWGFMQLAVAPFNINRIIILFLEVLWFAY